jgi:hypothetical protein
LSGVSKLCLLLMRWREREGERDGDRCDGITKQREGETETMKLAKRRKQAEGQTKTDKQAQEQTETKIDLQIETNKTKY